MQSDAIKPPITGRAVRFPAADGYELGGFLWIDRQPSETRPLVIITCATSVRCRYYARFAAYLFQHGFDVLTYDYRGIGESRPQRLRGFDADWVDWGERDLEGAIRYGVEVAAGRRLQVVAHSIGGFAVGVAPSNGSIERVLSVGSQFAYWRDYASADRLRMIWKWHVVMPILTRLFGYFPAKKLGWMEDTPAGVARDWSGMKARFEETVRGGGGMRESVEAERLRQRFEQLTAPILAISLSDDSYGTIPAVHRLLAYFNASERRHLHLKPSDIGHEAVGHFAFFHDRFRDTLWPLALHWLRHGSIPPGLSASLVAQPGL